METHPKYLAQNVHKPTFNKHVWLCCPETDSPDSHSWSFEHEHAEENLIKVA